MKAKPIIAIIITMLSVAMVFPFVASAASAQKWHFSDTAYTGTKVGNSGGWCDGQCDNMMYKEPTSGTTASANFSHDQEAYWYAENPAEVYVSFGEYAWTAHIWYDMTQGTSGILSVGVYSMDSDGTATCLAWSSQSISDPASPPAAIDVTLNDYAGSQVIPSGERLVFGIENLGENTTVTIYYNSSSRLSYVQSPETDPGYPVPELATIVLSGAGLAVLASYIWLRRCRQHKVVSSG